ncbi:MAG: bifunctional folylpolyglutamate synthase/dihydrofolate synthase [Clostridia bacterium]|nr:bifunctional folylpolyglutamate synthase/dihydrofolate synthase [Clostridia bacterium]
MDFDQAISYLQNLTKFGMNFGLGRITELLNRLDNPQETLRIIHIGGTNGKGSTSAILNSVLQAGGYRVGVFTSPHLHSYTERYRINGREIEHQVIAGLIAEVRPHLENMVAEGFEHPTEFEVSTALAFMYFAREQVDFLMLEVGLGGAIDSTNVVTPLISVITNIGMDHMDYLGNSIAEIARVKAGIIKPGVPVVTAAERQEALEVIREAAREKGAALVQVGGQVRWEVKSTSMEGLSMDWWGRTQSLSGLIIPLLGRHQAVNAATALAVVEALGELGSLSLNERQIREGLAATRWPARLEIVQRAPLVVIDGAHNLDGAKTLRQALQEFFRYQDLILVIGMLGDKEREKVVAELAPLAKAVVVTKPNSPRAGDWQNLAVEVRKYVSQVYLIENISEAVNNGIALAGPLDLVCITGSLYMVAEAREKWHTQAEL